MAQGFSERAVRVTELLADDVTTFLLVTAPEREPIDEAVFFWRRLQEARLPFGGVLVNKVHPDYIQLAEHGSGPPAATADLMAGLPGDLERTLGGAGTPDLAQRVYENFERYRSLAVRDRENMARLTQRLDEDRVICVPYLDEDVHDLGGLAQINRYLFVSEEERREILESVAV
jgi:anion-transporting  ArsA/GET3 family ATPase